MPSTPGPYGGCLCCWHAYSLQGNKVNQSDAHRLPVVVVQYAFNLFSHNSPMTGNGYNEEEMKMVKETHKIWGQPDIAITATCIRVPVMRAHAESINLEFERDVSEEEVMPLYRRLECQIELYRQVSTWQEHGAIQTSPLSWITVIWSITR